MLTHTLDQITDLKLHGLKAALLEQLEQPGHPPAGGEVIEERTDTGSTLVTSQFPVKEWYAYFKNPTLADAIVDRLIHNAHRVELQVTL